ncbi:MAG: exopolysaccharide biosynthesis polyprenyl glycosylphosphotransferase [Bacteroidales bacterium]|nr:exopolysaccharide biosynthesis polyprenyl glycosylphosphotransferase [Bacteroidales bacterium]
MEKDKKYILRYAILDYIATLAAWQLFNIYRFYEVRSTVYFSSLNDFLMNTKAYLMSAGLPLFWLIIYFYFGYYAKPRQKNHTSDLLSTLFSTLAGSLIIFFVVIINDYPEQYTLYYRVFAGLFLIHFFCTWFVRFLQTSRLLNLHAEGKLGINVLIVGSGREANKLSRQMQQTRNGSAYVLKGFVRLGYEEQEVPDKEMLGGLEELKTIIDEQHIEALILATDQQDSDYTEGLLKKLYVYRLDILSTIHKQDLLFSNITLYSLPGVPLKHLIPVELKPWEQILKRSADILVSVLGLLVLSPLFLFLSLRIRLESAGPVLYRQERLGKDMKPFTILKFRTMYARSEPEGPLLSSLNDERITPFGRFMRRYRLDELPQLWNVLKSDMSLVGPRPERRYYMERIVERAPHYHLIYRVKPGITSLGMVKYGYADSVEKMVERLEYDLIYLKNQSLLMDLKILLFTFKPIALGKGI